MKQRTTNEKYPLVSIVTPSYNQGQFIEDTILSVKNQDYPNIEHIIVDGQSTDNTLEILKRYENSYNLCWISEPDEGQADAINKGFRMTNGEVIGWLNSDDCYLKNTIVSKIVRFFSSSKQIGIIYGDNIEIDENNLVLRIRCGISRFSYRLLLWCNYFNQPTIFFHRKVLNNHTLDKSLKIAMDYDLWLRLGKIYKFHYLDEIVSAARKHATCKTVSSPSEVKNEGRIVRRRYRNFSWGNLISRLVWHVVHRYQMMKGISKIRYLYSINYAFPLKFDNKFLFILRHLIPGSIWQAIKEIGGVKIIQEKPIKALIKNTIEPIMPKSIWNILKSIYYKIAVFWYLLFGRRYKLGETTIARERRVKEGFFEKYCVGKGIDIGYGGDLLTPSCDGWDYEHGDAQYLKTIKDSTYDFVYSSHCLEDLKDSAIALKNWWRVLKPGGFLIIYIPHRDLFEKKKKLPSERNPDHKHFFLLNKDEPPDTLGIVPLIEKTLNSFNIVYAKICNKYSIEVVVKKTE